LAALITVFPPEGIAGKPLDFRAVKKPMTGIARFIAASLSITCAAVITGA